MLRFGRKFGTSAWYVIARSAATKQSHPNDLGRTRSVVHALVLKWHRRPADVHGRDAHATKNQPLPELRVMTHQAGDCFAALAMTCLGLSQKRLAASLRTGAQEEGRGIGPAFVRLVWCGYPLHSQSGRLVRALYRSGVPDAAGVEVPVEARSETQTWIWSRSGCARHASVRAPGTGCRSNRRSS